MSLDNEFRHHLHELMVETCLNLRDEEGAYERRLVWEARQTHNGAAVPIAYSNAAIHAFRTRIEAIVTKYLDALEKCGIEVDEAVEKEMLQHIGSLTSASHSLVFPPALKGEHPQAVRRAYAMERARVASQLYKNAANRLREAKMRARKNSVDTRPTPMMSHPDDLKVPLAPKIVGTHQPNNTPTVFISYSWESSDHCNWVLGFATELRRGGINVIFDQWHLPHGGDRTLFMERTVESDFVLVICTPEYAEKANERSGGVGYEAMIITSQLANSIGKNKFIPVLRSGDWDTALPV